MPAAAAIDERVACGERFFGAEADRLARLCHRMAERFARGGRLVAFGVLGRPTRATSGTSPSSSCTRSSSASARCRRSASRARTSALLARPDDIAMAFGDGPEVAAAVGAAAAPAA